MKALKCIVLALVFAASVAAPVLAVSGCENTAHVKNAEVAGMYAVELNLCVEKSDTREESQKCRCEVSKRYNRPCDVTDGGPE